MRTIAQDVRHSVRLIAGRPGFFVSALLTLALGIAFTTATFSVIHAVLLRPLPYKDPGDLLVLRERKLPQFPEFSVAPGNFLFWREHAGSDFVGMAPFRFTSANVQVGNGNPERFEVDPVGAQLFSLLGVSPVLGRGFTARDEQEGAAGVVLLSYGAWQRRFAGSPSVVGQTIRIDLAQATIVGVMPRGFAFPGTTAEMWVPMVLTAQERQLFGSHYLAAIARLRPGVTLAQARADFAVLSRRLQAAHPADDDGWEALAIPLRDYDVRDVRTALLVLFGAVALVLLIACVNVANLLLARGAGRRKELAIRAALGATRGRLVRQLLVENAILSCVGATVGLLAAGWMLRALVFLLPDALPRESTIGLDGSVLLFAAALACAAPLVFGLLPALHASHADLRGALATGGRQGSAPPARRTRFALAAVEMALAMMLLVGAGLLIRSFAALAQQSPGFTPSGAVMARISLPDAKYSDGASRQQFYRALLERAAALPTVSSVGLTQSMPLVNDMVDSFQIEGRPVAASARPSANFFAVSQGYFAAMRLRLVRGRTILPGDREGGARVAVISESMAERYFPGQDPLGKRIKVSQGEDAWREIVGVVGDVKQYDLSEAPHPQIYESWQQHPYFGGFTLVARVRGVDPAAVVPDLRVVVRGIDPDVPLSAARTLDDLVSESIRPQRFSALLIGAFALSAVILAAVGLYGLLAFMVGQRAREFAIRVAHGADGRDILRLVLANAAAVCVTGLAAGVVGALLLRRVLAGLLYGVSADDPITYGAVAVLLAVVAGAASVVPALRATRADPIAVLRAE